MDNSLVRSRILRRVSTLTLLLVCVAVLFWLAPVLISGRVFQIDDYLEYWSAGRLNLAGQNPFSPDLMEVAQRAIGRTEFVPVMMWTPPMSLALAMPFALLPYPLSRLVWLLFQTTAVFVGANWLWEIYGGSRSFRWVAWVIAFLFSATLTALHKGQISPLIVLGLAGFLRFEKLEKHAMAGAFVALTALKPHLLYLFWIALLLWSWRRRWTELVTAAGVMLAGTVIAALFNPFVVLQYVQGTLNDAPIWWHTPTLGGVLRGLLGPELRWLQFAPMLLGIAWLIVCWRSSRHDWRWPEQIPLLVTVSVVTAAYGWTFDQVVLLVMLLSAATVLSGARQGTIAWALIVVGVGLNFVALGLRGVLTDDKFWWLPLAWLLWYLLLRRWIVIPGAILEPNGHTLSETSDAGSERHATH